jgi:hypothetical protein
MLSQTKNCHFISKLVLPENKEVKFFGLKMLCQIKSTPKSGTVVGRARRSLF